MICCCSCLKINLFSLFLPPFENFLYLLKLFTAINIGLFLLILLVLANLVLKKVYFFNIFNTLWETTPIIPPVITPAIRSIGT